LQIDRFGARFPKQYASIGANTLPIDICQAPAYFQSILRRIGDVLDADLEIESFDEEWVNFSVDDYTDQEALRELELHSRQVLIGSEPHNFRILCPWDPSDDSGLWLHSLRHSDSPAEYLTGNWYY
jgi:hypothetical protein